ncbi:MAG: VOC family protein [Chloroflexi bacterium]|nr:VOC family protein [Chloroflexota bacterium]
MPYAINHLHLKSDDPEQSALWWGRAFNFTTLRDTKRSFGDRFLICQSENGISVMISDARTDEVLGPSDANPHLGLEHFGFDSEDLESDIARLEELGADLLEPPIEAAPGVRICFLRTPDGVRVELVEARGD